MGAFTIDASEAGCAALCCTGTCELTFESNCYDWTQCQPCFSCRERATVTADLHGRTSYLAWTNYSPPFEYPKGTAISASVPSVHMCGGNSYTLKKLTIIVFCDGEVTDVSESPTGPVVIATPTDCGNCRVHVIATYWIGTPSCRYIRIGFSVAVPRDLQDPYSICNGGYVEATLSFVQISPAGCLGESVFKVWTGDPFYYRILDMCVPTVTLTFPGGLVRNPSAFFYFSCKGVFGDGPTYSKGGRSVSFSLGDTKDSVTAFYSSGDPTCAASCYRSS